MDILLDTTIQIDRITGTKQRQKAIKDVLADRKVYSSTYVLGEYYATVVSDLVTLYALFLQDKDIGETGKRITEQVFARSQSRVSKLYANILAMCEFDVEEVEDTFQLYMDLIQDEFFLNLEGMLDGTKCVRGSRKIEYEDNIPFLPEARCRKSEKICDICPFWERARQEAEKLMASEEIDGKIRGILHSAKDNEQEYRGNNCKTLGDTVISLEAKKSRHALGICSSNKKDFQPICDAIGVELAVPDYSRSRMPGTKL